MRISDWSSDVCSSCLADAELGHEAVVSAVLGHIADAGLETLASAVAGDVLAVEQDLSGVRLDQAEQRLDQLGLSVALDPGDPDDLAGPDLERDVLDHLVTARVRSEEHTSELQSLMRISYAVFFLKKNTHQHL